MDKCVKELKLINEKLELQAKQAKEMDLRVSNLEKKFTQSTELFNRTISDIVTKIQPISKPTTTKHSKLVHSNNRSPEEQPLCSPTKVQQNDVCLREPSGEVMNSTG